MLNVFQTFNDFIKLSIVRYLKPAIEEVERQERYLSPIPEYPEELKSPSGSTLDLTFGDFDQLYEEERSRHRFYKTANLNRIHSHVKH